MPDQPSDAPVNDESIKDVLTWGARWIVPVDRAPIREASMTIADGVIVEITPGGQSSADQDLGDTVLVPKFVNAHTHLEFSDLQEPVGHPGIAITDWIPLVVADRMQRGEVNTMESVKKGIREIIQHGTSAAGEIATTPWFQEPQYLTHGFHLSHRSDCYLTCFMERLGNKTADNSAKIQEAKHWLQGTLHSSCIKGISPHAPYSLNDDLFGRLIDWAVADGLPVAMHLAESEQELQWLSSGDGPFLDMLEEFGAVEEIHHNRKPAHYIRELARANNALIIHGNYLDDQELDLIAANSNLHMVYCPRTHRYFEHAAYPLQKIIDRGINLAIGTDSRASNPDLNLLAELQTVQDLFPDRSPREILEMGTINGARALKMDHRVGSLTVGKAGKFLALSLNGATDPYAPLFDKNR